MGFETPIPPEVEVNKPVIDMGQILEKVAPIEGTFAPDEEVRKLWSVPRDKRREAISVFKDKLARQREAWALCRTNIEKRIEVNPDLPREEMVGIVRKFASHYGFAEAHVKVAESLVDDYIKMHKRVNEVREKYPNDIALINRLTGVKFDSDASDFTVEVGPMSIEITGSGSNVGRIYEKSGKLFISSIVAGFSNESGDLEPIKYLVVNKDISSSAPNFYFLIIPHEREHLKNLILKQKLYGTSGVRDDVREQLNRGVRGFLRHQIIERVLRFERDFESEILQQYESTKDPERKAFLLAEYMRLKREAALNEAKNEIIARETEPDYVSLTDTRPLLTRQGGSYDFLADIRDCDGKENDSLWQKTAQRVLVNEYRQIIDNAIIAFEQLMNNGYSQPEVTAMLTDKRLAEWPKTARRLLKQKRRR